MLKPWMRLGWPRKRVETLSMTPGVSMDWLLNWKGQRSEKRRAKSAGWIKVWALSAMELITHVFHDIKETVVDIGMLCELDLNLVQVRKRIFDVEGRL